MGIGFVLLVWAFLLGCAGAPVSIVLAVWSWRVQVAPDRAAASFGQSLPHSSRRALPKLLPVTQVRVVAARRKLLERVRAVSESDYFLYRVKKVLVFGSYLQDLDKANDIDVAVEFGTAGA
ncbi:MAG: hypothetical protein DMG09_20830 [Acidobacteria bacterium]|nr:MAG: hypothetical protein DMG09_20830 [Acidobacteriota bacterium]